MNTVHTGDQFYDRQGYEVAKIKRALVPLHFHHYLDVSDISDIVSYDLTEIPTIISHGDLPKWWFAVTG